MNLGELYQFAHKENIPIYSFPLPETGSLALRQEDGSCVIAMDPALRDGGGEERVHLAHELGHCATGSFYCRDTAVDCRGRHEYRANKWAIRKCISRSALDEAVALGYTEMWQLAEYFSLPEWFVRQCVCLYVHGNLSTELYF